MPLDKGLVRKAPVKREHSNDSKTSVNKTVKESQEKTVKMVKSVYGLSSKPPSKVRDPSVPKVKQDVGDVRPSKDSGAVAKKRPTDKPEKVTSDRRREPNNAKEPIAKSRAFDASKSDKPTKQVDNAKVAPVSSHPFIKSRRQTGEASQQKPQASKHASSPKGAPVKSKASVITHTDKKPPSLPSKAPIAVVHASSTSRQLMTQKMSVSKSSHGLPKKQERERSSTRTAIKLVARDATRALEKWDDAKESPQGGKDGSTELEMSVSRLGRARTRTRTLSPEEVKVLRNIVAKNLEHRKKRDVSSSRASPKQSSPNVAADKDELSGDASAHIKTDASQNEEYSDDFEDYESDFEDATESELNVGGSVSGDSEVVDSVSDDEEEKEYGDGLADTQAVEMTGRQQQPVEEEKKMDSGNYDLAEKRRKGRELQEIKNALERENSAAAQTRKLTSEVSVVEPVATDEGFVEEKPEDLKCSSELMVSNTNFINFANARKRQLEKRATAKVKKRGEELLGMVTLDTVGFSLLDLAPIPYEIYMKSYGRSNTMQVHVQTNEDSINQEAQTDDVHMKNKWTQKPVSFCTKLQPGATGVGELVHFSQEHLGVGGDEADLDQHMWKNRLTFNSIRLNQFLASAGQVMLVLLEEGQARDRGLPRPSPDDLAFSDGRVPLGVESVPFLAGRAVTCALFPHTMPDLLLTVHAPCLKVEDKHMSDEDAVVGQSMICTWSCLEPSRPLKVLAAGQTVCTACFDPTKASLVLAGLVDGSVCVWDLAESSQHHKAVHIGDSEWTIRSPTYTTAEIHKSEGHLGPVVSLQPLVDVEGRGDGSARDDLSPMQVCSLEESGLLLVWTVVRSRRPGGGSDLGLAPWGRVRLLRSASLDLRAALGSDLTLQCCDLAVDQRHADHVYAGTISGQVVHCLRSGSKPHPPAYISTWGGLSSVRCIEPCPFGQPFFLVGCTEGIVRLHSQASEKPLLTLAATGDALGQGPPITSLQWSRSHPFVFYALDNLSRLHTWNLSVSDMYPQSSIHLADGTATTFRLSPYSVERKDPPQLVLASLRGSVELHRLKEPGCRSVEELASELKKFLFYTSLL